VKDKYPIGSDLEVVDNVRFIKSIEKKKDEYLCTDPDVGMAMRAKGFDIVKKRPWMVMDKEVYKSYTNGYMSRSIILITAKYNRIVGNFVGTQMSKYRIWFTHSRRT